MHSVPELTVTDMHNYKQHLQNPINNIYLATHTHTQKSSPSCTCVDKCTSLWFPERLLGSQSPVFPLNAAGPEWRQYKQTAERMTDTYMFLNGNTPAMTVTCFYTLPRLKLVFIINPNHFSRGGFNLFMTIKSS